MGGYNAVDNGYAQFNRVRIPREHMLSRFAQITKEGDYIKPPHVKMSYGGVSLSAFTRIRPLLRMLTCDLGDMCRC